MLMLNLSNKFFKKLLASCKKSKRIFPLQQKMRNKGNKQVTYQTINGPVKVTRKVYWSSQAGMARLCFWTGSVVGTKLYVAQPNAKP